MRHAYRPRAGSLSELAPDVVEEIEAVLAGVRGSCIATGSLVEGLGNANSDVDMYVVQGPDEISTNPIAIGIRGTRYVDCEFLNLRSLDELTRRFDDPTDAELAALQQRDLDRYYRTSVALHLRVSDEVADVLARFHRENACRQLVRWARMHAFDRLAASSVAIAGGRIREAVVLAREASEWRARAELAALGEGYPSSKWTPVKAARHFGANTAGYARCVRGLWLGPDTLAEVLEDLRAEVGDAPSAAYPDPQQGWELAEGVRVVTHDSDGVHLIRGRKSVTHERRHAALVSALGEGRDWNTALGEVAAAWRLPTREVAAASAAGLRTLATDGFLREVGA